MQVKFENFDGLNNRVYIAFPKNEHPSKEVHEMLEKGGFSRNIFSFANGFSGYAADRNAQTDEIAFSLLKSGI